MVEAEVRAISAQRYLLALAGVFAQAIATVVVAALAGVTGLRLAAVALAAGVFAFAYVLTPSPCKCQFDRRDLYPVIAMIVAATSAIAVTGGIASPFLALLPTPFMMGWMMFHKSREASSLGLLVPIILAGLILTTNDWHLPRHGYIWLAAWTTLISAGIIAKRIRRLFVTLRAARGSLDRVRNGALSAAEARRRAMEQMTTKLAHELKNPLSAIKSLVQLELRRATDEKSTKRLGVVLHEAERMQELMRDYLSFARPTDEITVGDIDLSVLMAEIGDLLAGRAEAAGVELSVSGTGGALRADSRLLKEALINVASNALEATPRGGYVEVRYHVGERGTNIVVRDTGKGMPPEVKDRIGTPFFTTRDGGTGLGVVIAKTAISQHHGTLEYASTPGVGTTATIALPVWGHV